MNARKAEIKTHQKQLLQVQARHQHKVNHMRGIRFHDRRKHYQIATFRANALNVVTQQNMIARQVHGGMLAQVKEQNSTEMTQKVVAQKQVTEQRRNYVRDVLSANAYRQRQVTVGMHLENQHNLHVRHLQDFHKIELLKARRRRMVDLRDLVSSASSRGQYPGNTIFAQAGMAPLDRPLDVFAFAAASTQQQEQLQQQQAQPQEGGGVVSLPSLYPRSSSGGGQSELHAQVAAMKAAGNKAQQGLNALKKIRLQETTMPPRAGRT